MLSSGSTHRCFERTNHTRDADKHTREHIARVVNIEALYLEIYTTEVRILSRKMQNVTLSF